MSRSFVSSVVATQPISGQKTGTSGLRKKVSVFAAPNYLNNWIQALFNSLPSNELAGSTLVLGGDGRYWNSAAIQVIIKMAAANGVGRLLIGQNGILSTPAVSAIIRARKAYGGIILTASHNPGGKDGDFGIKFNTATGGPAPEAITDLIFVQTEKLTEYKIAADLEDVDLSTLGRHSWNNFEVEIIDSVEDYLALLQQVFDFEALKQLVQRPGLNLLFDSMNGVTGAYTKRIFVDTLGALESSLLNGTPKEDFGGHHPDPNLTYAAELVTQLNTGKYDLGAAWDGDGDRNMILGKRFFVTPSDSVAILSAYANRAIPYFKNGVKAVARSMPTSAALDRVAEKLGIQLYEVPTGWKFFGNIMDSFEKDGTPGVICGEESFGTGSDHIREKDGIWAVLAWLSVLAYRNNGQESKEGSALAFTVEDIVKEHWAEYGRNFYTRYDYEEVDVAAADKVIQELLKLQKDVVGKELKPGFVVSVADEFEYRDPFDKSVSSRQGIRFIFANGSRFVVRLSGTGSSGATIRLYAESFTRDSARITNDSALELSAIISLALELSKMEEHTGRKAPTVIT